MKSIAFQIGFGLLFLTLLGMLCLSSTMTDSLFEILTSTHTMFLPELSIEFLSFIRIPLSSGRFDDIISFGKGDEHPDLVIIRDLER